MKIINKPILDKSLEQSKDVNNTKKTRKSNITTVKNINKDTDSSAKVSLSSRAKDFQRIKDAVKNTPDVDKEKVDKIKKAIKQGKFDVNYDKLAEKIVEHDIMYDLLS